ncbi:MAG TPA: L-threonylcarbamoyladenylate synthase [Pyrinomonadaceae bacterium]
MILPDNESTRVRAAETVKNGGVIAFRTDTFYGLGAGPFDPNAVRRIVELKGRDGKPILLVISDLAQVEMFILKQSSAFTRAADAFWPGPLTLVGPAVPNLSDDLTAGTGTIGLRLPDNDSLRSLLRLCGGALTATSANISGLPPAESVNQVEEHFGESIDLIIDGGVTRVTHASTVLDVSQSISRIIREGVISRTSLEEVLGSLISD